VVLLLPCLSGSGKDAQQNEALVKRYLRPGDVYLHSELQGASSCVVRNKGKPGSGREISPVALQEAGGDDSSFCISMAPPKTLISLTVSVVIFIKVV